MADIETNDREICFSIVIPCYNDGQYLERSISSVTAQSYQHWELMIVDDGSTDNTRAICKHTKSRLGNLFRYVYQTNSGVSAARNTGLKNASHDYIVFLDADDELDPQCLEHYAEVVRNKPQAQWLIGTSQWSRSQKLKRRNLRIASDRSKRFSQFLEKRLHLGNISNMCFAKQMLSDIEFPEDMQFGEDTVVFAILLATTDPEVIPKNSAIAHRRPDSLRSRATLLDLIESPLYQNIFDHPELPAEYAKFKNRLWTRHSRSIAKRAYREKEFTIAFTWFRQALRSQPWLLLDAKLLTKMSKSWWMSAIRRST